MLRTGIIQNKKLYVQAGGGVVYDSKPANEYKETINKSMIGRLLWRFSSTTKMKQSIGFSDREGIVESKVAQDTPASIDLSPELLKEIGTAARADNRWLVKNVGLDLAKYSYPL